MSGNLSQAEEPPEAFCASAKSGMCTLRSSLKAGPYCRPESYSCLYSWTVSLQAEKVIISESVDSSDALRRKYVVAQSGWCLVLVLKLGMSHPTQYSGTDRRSFSMC